MKKILIVDDSKMIIELLEKALFKTIPNIEILEASTYKEGVKHILQHGDKIDVAILDLNLPDAKDGVLIDIAESNNIKSVILSGILTDNIKKVLCTKNCIVDCIAKDGKKSIKSVVTSVNRVIKNKEKNILLVDDSKVQILELKKILERMNLNVSVAYDGSEAYDMIQKGDKKYSLIITDYYMPKMDGMELTFRLREQHDKDELGIIAISSANDLEIITQFLKIGANDFICKPSNDIEVMTRINSNLDLIDLFDKTIEMANKDYMTGAYNRRYFFESAKTAVYRANRDQKDIALAMIDIDKFKNINDTYGHDMGDSVICEVVNIVKRNLREADLFARFGGEEFAVLLEDISKKDVEKLFEKIRGILSKHPIKENKNSVYFTASIGIYYGKVLELDEMIKIADNALYHCKKNGRDQIHLMEK